MRAGLGTSVVGRVSEAAREAVQQSLQGIGDRAPDAALIVATAAWGQSALRELVAIVTERLGCGATVGGSVDGVLVGEGWAVHRPAVAVLALADVDAVVTHSEDLANDEGRAALELAIGQAPAPGPGDLMILFSDALGLAPAPILDGLAASLPGLPIIGLGASEPEGASPLVWAGSHLASAACVALTIRSKRPSPSIAVTHACRRLGPVHAVTRTSGHWVLGLDGRPALEALLESQGASEAGRNILVGLLEDGGDPDRLDGLMIRNVVGSDRARGGFALPAPVRAGTRLVALAPDADEVRDRAGVAGPTLGSAPGSKPPVCGLYLACRAGGDALLAGASHGAALSEALGGAPLLGVSAAYQVAPSVVEPHRPRLHTYSGVSVLIR